MKFAKRLFQKFAVSIVAILSCFDRVIFKGYLPFGDENHLNGYVDNVLKMRRKDFVPWVKKYSETLVQHARQFARQLGQLAAQERQDIAGRKIHRGVIQQPRVKFAQLLAAGELPVRA